MYRVYGRRRKDRKTQSKSPTPASKAPAVKPTAANVTLLVRREPRAPAPLVVDPCPLFCDASPVAAGRPLGVSDAVGGARPIVATMTLSLSVGS